MKTRIVFGSDSIKKLSSLLEEFAFTKALIVTGKTAMRKTGILDKVIRQVGKNKAVVFEGAEPNPKAENCDNGAELGKKEGCDLIIGLGGGSALDCAKGVAVLMTNDIDLREILGNYEPLKNETVPLIMIPTTSGTASEINKFAVITNEKNGKKMVLKENKTIPELAIVDPKLTIFCSPGLTAATGLDALCHAIESYWSTNSNPVSKMFALEAIELVNNNLEKACNNGEDLEAREGMSMASLFAGMAFSNTGTTDLHKLSYPLTERFGTAHGFGCAIALPHYFEFNGKENSLDEIAKALGKETCKEAADRIREIMKNIKAPTRLGELSVKKEDIELIADEGYSNNERNNPRKITKNELKKMLEELL